MQLLITNQYTEAGMNLKQWQRSKKIKAEAEEAAKRTIERVLNAVKEPAMSEFKENDQNAESEVEFTQCNDCGYRSTSSADCCISCGSLNTHKDAISYEEWCRDY